MYFSLSGRCPCHVSFVELFLLQQNRLSVHVKLCRLFYNPEYKWNQNANATRDQKQFIDKTSGSGAEAGGGLPVREIQQCRADGGKNPKTGVMTRKSWTWQGSSDTERPR